MEDIVETSQWKDLNLTSARRILEHAGRRDPTSLQLEPPAQLQALIDILCELSVHDGLTGLVNATFFRASLARELDRCSRTGRTCSLMMIDLDRFKLVNDTYGHQAGDEVLRATATYLKESLRGMDTAARIGGDEFAVIFPECTPGDAMRAAARIHGGLNPLRIETGSLLLSVTASAGLVWTDPGVPISLNMLVAHADEELYRAKNSGRRCLIHPAILPTRLSHAEHELLVLARREEDSCEP